MIDREVARDLLAQWMLQVEDEYGDYDDEADPRMAPYLDQLEMTWAELRARARAIENRRRAELGFGPRTEDA